MDLVPAPAATAPAPPAAAVCGLGHDSTGPESAGSDRGPLIGADVPHHPDLAALTAAGPVPDLVLLAVPPAPDAACDLPALVRARVHAVLDVLRAWPADERYAGRRLAVLLRTGDLGHAALYGLVRAAQAEHPGRFLLVDSDGSAAPRQPSPPRSPPGNRRSRCATARYGCPG
ncbi:hypothetical protein ACFQ3Z_05255 [Streptomyces nogalater]